MVDFFWDSYKNASTGHIFLEFLVFVCGILSVWFAKKENVLVYPVGLIATVISVYLLYFAGYIGDMIINAYFSIMSIYGWYYWVKGGTANDNLPITRTNLNEKIIGILLFMITFFVVLGVYKYFDYTIHPDNYVDMISSGIFFTGMWYMAKKKIENWTLWIIGDMIVVPLYAYRGLGMLSLQYLIFTILAVFGYLEWKKILKNQEVQSNL
ncbi:nicotinamide riboside transporter PnuC [Flavobacterium flavipallidum]|uniref:Nicotinamide riboside transporter PnuC n=1 Tax=Flavobacterium flavipallidum TaxID=3139140 RepID=A0ABU9HHM6_9FLAO